MPGLLIDAAGKESVRRTLEDDECLVVGGASHCDVIASGPDVADQHATLRLEGGDVHVVALSEGQPLVVNGETVTAAVLSTGDELCIGDVTISLGAAGPTEAPGSRLRGLEGYVDSVAAAVDAAAGAAPLRAEDGRRRIVLDDLDIDLDELPELSREARALRRVLEITKRLARADSESSCREAVLDAALAVVGGDRAYFVAVDGSALDGDAATDGVESADVSRGETRAHRETRAGDGPDCRRVNVRASRDAAGDAVPQGELRASIDEIEDVLVRGRPMLLGAGDGPAAVIGVCAKLGSHFDEVLLVECAFDRGLHGVVERDLLRAIAEQAAIALGAVRLRGELSAREADLVEAGARAERLNRRLADLLQRRTLELRETRAELARIDAAEGFSTRFTEIVGRGAKMLAVLRQVDRVARTTVPVLFEGESGTGKELMARALHTSSDRADDPFVAENCAALPDTLLENELFGHARGAFTGADTDAMGLFERADGGTLFLDEVGDMSPSLQTRLLRVVQEGEVRRVGASTVTRVDVRIVTATNRNLLEMVRAGSFR